MRALSCANTESHALNYSRQDMNRRRGFKAQIPEEDFQEGPQGLKYYDMTPGKGAMPRKGDRIAVHYEIRWHGVTFMTSRCA